MNRYPNSTPPRCDAPTPPGHEHGPRCASSTNKAPPSNYVTVAQAGSVSRSLLYRDPELRAEIDRLRNPAPTAMPRQPAAQLMSQASRHELDAALRYEIKELRHENQALRSRLATVLGEIRSQHHQTRPDARSELVNDLSPTQ